MKLASAVLGVLLVCGLAFVLRARANCSASEHLCRLRQAETDYHLRSVELALAQQKSLTFDRFLAPPSGAAIPWTIPFDALVAGLAERVIPHDFDARETSGVSERDLEHFATRVGPALGMLTVLTVFIAVLAFGGGVWWALAAALAYCLHPTAIATEAARHLDPRALHNLLFGCLACASALALRAREGPDILQGGLLAGLLAGFALALGPAGALGAAVVWATFLIQGRSRTPHALAARRAGVFMTIVGALVVTLVARQTESALVVANSAVSGRAAAWLDLASIGMFASALPFLVLLLEGQDLATGRRWIHFGAASVALLLLAPRAFGAFQRSTGSLRTAREILAANQPVSVALVVSALLACLCAAIVWRARHPQRTVALGITIAFVIMIALGAAAQSVLLVGATVLSAGIGSALRVADERSKHALPIRTAGLVLFAAIYALGAFSLRAAPQATPDATWSRALERLRSETDALSPWNVPTARPGGSVLTSWPRGLDVTYRARRPATTTAFDAHERPDHMRRVARVLLATEPSVWGPELESLDVAYVIAGAAPLRDLAAVRRAARPDSAAAATGHAATLLGRLSHGPVPPGFSLIIEQRAEPGAMPELMLYAVERVPARER